MKIRVAEKKDVERMIQIHHDSVMGLAKNHYSEEVLKAWAFPLSGAAYEEVVKEFEANLKRAGDITLVAEIEGNIAAFCYIECGKKYLNRLYIDPVFAGRGVGRALLLAGEKAARAQGVDALYAEVVLNSVGFYEKMGYRSLGCGDHLHKGVQIACVKMEKVL